MTRPPARSGVRRVARRTIVAMGTLVSAEAIGSGEESSTQLEAALDRALRWFLDVESVCTRFDPRSELMQLTARAGHAVPASDMLYHAVRFALAVAAATNGAFDPTQGAAMEARGVNREHRTRQIVHTELPGGAPRASFRDVRLDPDARTITLERPLVLDLGAVAKGLAVDMAAAALRPLGNFAVNAGGDLYFGGTNARGEPWTVGVRHPQSSNDGWLDVLRVTDRAVCTSGDYERPHLLDPGTGETPSGCSSVTVIAPTAMSADALATAAFVLGPDEGAAFLEQEGVDGLIVTSGLGRRETAGWSAYREDSRPHGHTAPA